MAERNRAQPHAVLDELISVGVPYMTAFAAFDEYRRRFGKLVIAFGVGVGATGNELMRLGLQFPRAGKILRALGRFGHPCRLHAAPPNVSLRA